MEQSLCDTEDLSLFSGDILDVVDWSVANEQQFQSQDGLKVETLPHVPESEAVYTDLLSLGQSFYDPLENWLDTKVDLLDLFNDGDNVGDFLGENSAQLSLALQTAQASTLLDEVARLQEMPESPIMNHLAEHRDDTGVAIKNGDQIEGSKELFALLTQELGENVFTGLKDAPILPPMSPEDIESILSSEPCSPTQPDSPLIEQISPTIGKPVEQIHSAPGPVKNVTSPSKCSAPYSVNQSKSKSNIVDRKARKRQQNRDAALRYRLKKRAEGAEIIDECDVLESKNKDLKDNIEQMTREIQYLKDLMAEVFKARKKN